MQYNASSHTFNAVATGPNFIATSDAALKDDIVPQVARGDLADRLELVSFKWKSDGRHDRGVIA